MGEAEWGRDVTATLIAIGAGIASIIGALWFSFRSGRRKNGEVSLDRINEGIRKSNEARDAMDKGKSPEDVVRQNDGRWK